MAARASEAKTFTAVPEWRAPHVEAWLRSVLQKAECDACAAAIQRFAAQGVTGGALLAMKENHRSLEALIEPLSSYPMMQGLLRQAVHYLRESDKVFLDSTASPCCQGPEHDAVASQESACSACGHKKGHTNRVVLKHRRMSSVLNTARGDSPMAMDVEDCESHHDDADGKEESEPPTSDGAGARAGSEGEDGHDCCQDNNHARQEGADNVGDPRAGREVMQVLALRVRKRLGDAAGDGANLHNAAITATPRNMQDVHAYVCAVQGSAVWCPRNHESFADGNKNRWLDLHLMDCRRLLGDDNVAIRESDGSVRTLAPKTPQYAQLRLQWFRETNKLQLLARVERRAS